MRIALFHNLPSGGAKRALYEWTRRLSEKHLIDVYTFSGADHGFCDLRPYVNNYYLFDFVPRKLYQSPFGRLNQYQRWRDLGKLIFIGRQIAEKINVGGYDIVFSNTCLYTFIPTFLQFIRIPSVHYLHEPVGVRLARRFERPYLNRNRKREFVDRFDPLIRLYWWRLHGVQRKGLMRIKLLLSNSHFTREQMKNTFDIDSPLCPLGVDSDCYHPLPEVIKEDMVISVGELSPRKGFDFLIKSLAQISVDQRPTLCLACNRIDLKEKDYIQDLAHQNGVVLQILNNLSSEELSFHYNRAKLCVYAPVMEPFGLVPLEAMACGTPVIGVREGGVQESIIHGYSGLLVERNLVEFSNAIKSLLKCPERLNQYGRQARKLITSEWSWKKSTTILEEYLTSTL